MPIYNVSSAPVAVASEPSSAAQVHGALIEAKAEPASAAEGRGAIIEASAGPSGAAQAHGAIIEAATDRGWIVKEDEAARGVAPMLDMAGFLRGLVDR